ncbi:hypothetical protein DOTSEDRAFT_67468 [Dothistroma septosporum NZE10]|uniref:1-phosphatidylinositol-3-phosphate 5-kinase n=1 Tax=Dothistroma septosporum (strain NZE10 / CBS 128990) TaxID=675120 RepID=N1Q1P9_DOTSN|nr:hypothetical protein DOTSEDRAFT_67468 [Dothistroma septosporum NZE10]
MPPEASSSPAQSTSNLIPFLSNRSRRGSLASITSRNGAPVDKEILAQALDDIHTSASKSHRLTSFHDFDGENSRGPKELVSSGVGRLYNRFMQSVSGATAPTTKDGQVRPKSSESRDSFEASRNSLETSSFHSNTSPTASRSAFSMTVAKPTPDAASVATLSVPASPVVNSFSSNEGVYEGKSRPAKLHTADGLPIPSIDLDEAQKRAANDRAVAKAAKAAPEPPSKEDLDLARTAWVDGDRSETATDALARVLSHHEVSILDSPKPSSKPVRAPQYNSAKLDNAIDDSDFAEGQENSFRAPQSLKPTATIRLDGIEHGTSIAQQLELQRPPMVRVGPSHLPGFQASRTSSATNSGDAASLSSSRTASRRPTLDPSPNLNSAMQRSRSNLKLPPSRSSIKGVADHYKRRVLSKEFWMKDANAKVCFNCGQSFSTFRRKHHCRTCGQIFDDRCTTLVNGRQFGQANPVRLCKPCEGYILGDSDDDDSTVFSDDGDDYTRSPGVQKFDEPDEDLTRHIDGPGFSRTDTEVTTPSIGIPVSRRNREAKSRNAVIEFDMTPHPALARPSSSHSLISLSRRPRSSSHRRRHSRHQPGRGLRASFDERGPFHCDGDPDKKSSLPTFHNDNIIDPDLAAFLSDEGSDDEDQPNIMSVVEGHGASPGDREKIGFSSLFASALRKGRSKTGDKGTAASSTRAYKEDEVTGLASRHLPRRLTRSRNLSNGSIQYDRPSTRRSKSNLLLNTIESATFDHKPISPLVAPEPSHAKVVCSSALYAAHSKERDDIELYPASYEHVKRLLGQQLRDAKIANPATWQKALMPVLMQCTDDVEPDVQRGDDMDIRHYIKLKKIPGGRPGDTSYVSGVVFSKNIALKTMSRSISNPRICIVTFAIEYARHEAHFMSLEPVIAQEQEYLENLVSRIAALRPTVLLVQKHVSGSALRLLDRAGITVAYNIKESVLAAVARMTETTLIKSIDKLGIDPSHLGFCDSFHVKTYLSDGLRKTYIYLSGCEPDLGCTIVLRGADTRTLRCIKRIAEFMCYVAYNLKLENYLMRDGFVSIPHTAAGHMYEHGDPSAGERDPRTVTLQETQKTIRETLGREMSDITFKYAAVEKDTRDRILSASPFVVFMLPHILTQLRDLEQRLATYKLLRDEYAAADEQGEEEAPDAGIIENFKLVEPAMVNAPPSKDLPKAVREYLHAVHEDQFEKAQYTYETQERQWESFVSGKVNPFDPFSHQKIMVLYSTVSSVTSAPCTGPELLGIGFYAGYNRVENNHDEDMPFGQYIEELCMGAKEPCSDCSKKMYDHHRQYVHGYGQLSVSIQRQTAKLRGYANTILMWSTCRICRHETTVTPMSAHTWKYSFAKYLELSFWSSPLHPRGGGCKHDIHRDFLRCFGYQDKVVRFQYDAIDIYDVVVPRGRVTWKVEADLTVKNEQYKHFERRLETFTDSLRNRLEVITIDTIDGDLAVEARVALKELKQKAEDDREELVAKLQRKYATSRYFELIPLNRALRFMDEKAIEWDDEFAKFEDKYFPSETDIRKIVGRQLKEMFNEIQHPSAAASIASDVSDTEDGNEKSQSRKPGMPSRRPTVDEIFAEKAQDVLTSAVEDHKAENDDTDTLRPVKSAEDDVVTPASEPFRVTQPRRELEEAVEREDVKHLDLAVPSRSPGDTSVDENTAIVEVGSPESATSAWSNTALDEPFAIQPKPLSSGLLERIEQIRSSRAAAGEQAEMVESRIPRLADLKKRDASPRPVPPPLLRAQSQPGHPGHVARLSDHSIDAIAVMTAGDTQSTERPQPDHSATERIGVSRLASRVSKVAPSLIPRSIPVRVDEHSHSSTVSALAKHFEQLSREFEKKRQEDRKQRATRSRQARANPLASSRPVVEVYQNATDAVGERALEKAQVDKEAESDRMARQQMDDFVAEAQPEDNPLAETDGKSVESAKSVPDNGSEGTAPTVDTDADDEATDSEQPATRSRDLSDPDSSIMSSTITPDLSDFGSELTIPEHRKNVWFKYLSEFWSKRSASGWGNLEYPLHSNEHVFEDSDIIVREDEPSSVIALSLACADYNNKMKEFRNHPSKAPLAKHGHAHTHSQNSAVNPAEERTEEIEASLLSDTGTHLKYSFSHGPVKAHCKIFYAESFDALRRKCGVADRFIESLSRCLKFDSKGGKTKSLFLRTLDNRFIIKSLQEVELKAFTKFAPDYFNFMSYTLFHGVPSVIAKMFGLFQVNIRNPATGVDFSYYLLVMENLFYERNPNRRFDLKGSMRNRKIESTGQQDEVLLDENLVETIFESPLFVREHSRKLLQASVFNDTLWLCKQNVMDYSLMAGFDDNRKELVVGIIDCIRTYTWDKKLESWIKDRGKNKPTITSPKDYRNRFRVSMMQYVLQAPNCWYEFLVQMAGPKVLKEGDGGEEVTGEERA